MNTKKEGKEDKLKEGIKVAKKSTYSKKKKAK